LLKTPINKSFIYSSIVPIYTAVFDNLELTSIYKFDVNIKTLGLLIYSEFSQFLFMAALLLLLAMIGTIYLSYLKTFNLK
jgi:NADH:ubiquinone oxidoreductase subunit 6 (subunit J)